MKILTILSQKGGSGKSTLTVHLAVCAIRNGLKTAVLDIDKQGSSHRWNNIREESRRLSLIKSDAGTLPRHLEMAAKAEVDLLLIDTAPHSDRDGAIAAQLADFILIPCRPALFDLEAIFNTVQIARGTKNPYAVILNAAPQGNKLASETRAFLEKHDVPVMPLVIHQRAPYGHALFDGRSVHDYEPDGKAAAEIDELYDYLSGQLEFDERSVTV